MTFWLSKPIEELLSNNRSNHISTNDNDYDLSVKSLIIGSGYGAAMATLAIAEQQEKLNVDDSIWVFERGNEYIPDDFPKSIADVPGYINFTATNSEEKKDGLNWKKRLNQRQSLDKALWDIRVGEGVTTVAGNGLGGTSLVNANVAIEPEAEVYQNWPKPPSASWDTLLKPNFYKIKQLLGAKTLPKAESFSKYQALDQLARALGTTAEPVELTINFDDPTEHSADHKPCNNCGNCVIGCHSGAKGSLNMNAWPLARQLGVELFTGVTISYLEKIENGWLVHCFESRNEKKIFTVFAERVILSAGSIGSTEILMRSQTKEVGNGLIFSKKLGKQFSTNGDALIFGAGQRNKVNAVAAFPQEELDTSTPPGPTIIGKVRAELINLSPGFNTINNKFTVEDGTIPYPLKTLWKEMITTQSFIKRFVSCDETAWHTQNPYNDPLASFDSFANHSQILLAMGIDDNSQGELIADKNGKVTPKWGNEDDTLKKKKVSNDYFENLHQAFIKAESKDGFNGGQYLPNPAWKTLPEGFDKVVEGAGELPSNLISVHPLGGCSIGDSSESGVVNNKGQVFSGKTGSDIHSGLYVLDGAILPGAIGINPFLTIAALSYTLALDIIDDKAEGPERCFPKLTDERFRKIPSGAMHQILTADDEKISAIFEEELSCSLSGKGKRFDPLNLNSIDISSFNKILGFDAIPDEARKLIISIKIFFGENEGDFGQNQQSITEWLERPCMKLSAEATLSYDNSESVHSTPESYQKNIGTLQGTVCLGSYDKPSNCLESLIRIIKAICRYRKFRPHDLKIALQKAMSSNGEGDGLLKQLFGFLRVAKIHATYRYLEYEFGDTLTIKNQKIEGINLSGKKKLAYSANNKDIWSSLVNLPVTLRNSRADTAKFEMAVDLIKMLEQPSPIQVKTSPNTPASIMAMLAMGGYFVRSLFQTHFWSFGAPSYEHFKSKVDQEKPENPEDEQESRLSPPPTVMSFGNMHESQNRETYSRDKWARLTRYQPIDDEEAFNPKDRKSLLLVHGLAHSSRVFWTETIEVNFVQYFLNKNYDVWIVDHRTSANTIEEVDPTHTWDEIAHDDIPWAVKFIFEKINSDNGKEKKKIHVFSHCIGAGAVSIAALEGDLNFLTEDNKVESMLASLAPHAVTPWLYASKANRARCNVWNIFKDLNLIKTIEPMPHPETEGVEMIFDRLACAQIDDQERQWWKPSRDYNDYRGIGFPRTIYSRYTIFWGKQWNHENVNDETRFNFARMIGATPIAVLQQVFYSITRGRLVSHEGTNIYVNKENFLDNWKFPTLFLHGNKNTVFDINSSKLSAEKLTRYRNIDNPRAKKINDKLTARDYLENNVWIEIFDNYGHMDVIFGKNADRDIFPKIHHFFQAADKVGQDTLTPAYKELADNPEQSELIPDSSRIPSINSSEIPITGPILSRPRKGEGHNKNSIRLWLETWNLSDQVPSKFHIECTSTTHHNGSCTDSICSDTDKILSNRIDTRPREQFWLLNYTFTDVIDKRQYFLIEQENGHSKRIALDWHKMPWFKKAFDSDNVSENQALSFIVGSCFHPGTSFDREISSKAFKNMYDHVEEGVDHLLLLGDQIYADANANIFDPTIPFEKYRLRYRQAFANEDARKLFRNVPVYFAVDDHEFNDNWQGQFNEEVKKSDFDYATNLALLYQMHHDDAWKGNKDLWYDFESRGFPFFVMDTRMERQDREKYDRYESSALMSDRQINGFERWLTEHKNEEVLFIASGSTIAPISQDIVKANSLASNSDRLIAYPGFLEKIIHLLANLASEKTIIWLTGDPHFSSLTKCSLQQDNKAINIYQICSSGIYSPIPFANDNPNKYIWNEDFDWGNDNEENWKKAEKQSIQLNTSKNPIFIEFVQKLLSSESSHFVRVDLERSNNTDRGQNMHCKFNVVTGDDGSPILSIEC